MAEPFQFRWGPGRLAALGIHLDADQAACTETIGKAMVMAPLFEPGIDEPFQLEHPELGCLVRPTIVDIVLNDEVVDVDDYKRSTYRRQDRLDHEAGPEWRKFAKAVSESGDLDGQWDLWINEELTYRPVWDAVMVDSETADRISHAVDRAINATDLPLWEAYGDLARDGMFSEDDEDDYNFWVPLAQDFGISSALDENGWPVEEPEWDWAKCTPDLREHMDPDTYKIWTRLCNASRRGWSEFDKHDPDPRKRYGPKYISRADFNPW